MNMKIIWQGYGVKSCLKFVLKIVKEMKGFTPTYTPLGN
jgi:hypothetical protein